VPVAWAIWPEQKRLGAGAYWTAIEAVLAAAARVIPTDLAVTVLADRAYDVPPFIDRVAAHGWQWVIRLKAKGNVVLRDRRDREQPVRTLIAARVRRPGQRWKTSARLFKNAGWRPVHLVAIWATGADEPLVVISDQPLRWAAVAAYRRRFWCEPGFRNDKSHGWHWEQGQVRDLRRVQTLLVAMAWATLLTLGLGAEEAEAQVARLVARQRRPRTKPLAKPQPAKDSLFTLGLRRAQHWLVQRLPLRPCWGLPDFLDRTWDRRWYALQARPFIFQFVRL
jgi:hypothetical protein